MIPVTLTLDGFLSYRSRTRIDLSQIRVACVSGENGAGKSTLFDGITWALFGRARRNDDALIHERVDSCQVFFDFLYEGDLYRVDRSKTRGKSTTLEFHVQTEDGEWKPLTEAGVRATEERIRDILRLDYDTFVNTSFFLQGKADMFAVQPAGKRKEILSSILGLSVWDSYREETSSRRRTAQKNLEIQQSLLNEIFSELAEEDDRKLNLAQKEEILLARVKLHESKKSLLEKARTQTNILKREEEKLDLYFLQISSLEAKRKEIVNDQNMRQEELSVFEKILADEDEIRKSHQEFQQVRDALTEQNAVGVKFNELNLRKTKLLGDIQTEKARLKQELSNLKDQEKEIQTFSKELPVLLKELEEKKAEAAQLQAEIGRIETLEQEQEKNQQDHSEKKSEQTRLRNEMGELKERIESLSHAEGANCPLCAQPLTETHKNEMLKKLKTDGNELGDQFRLNKHLLDEKQGALQALQKEINSLRSCRSSLANVLAEAGVLQQRMDDFTNKINKWEQAGRTRMQEITELLKRKAVSSEAEKELKKLEKEIRVLQYSAEAHGKLRQREVELRESEDAFRKLEQARTSIDSYRREISGLEKQQKQIKDDLLKNKELVAVLEKTVKAGRDSQDDLAKLEGEIQEIQNEENMARRNVGAAQQLVKVLDALRKRKLEIETETHEISRKITRLQMLETAFGRDGIQALLIESAIPQIEEQANDILDRLSGGNMYISLETERSYADKKREDKKQTLDIIIRDSAGSRPYELFSGGEAFRINFAIRLALSRVLAQRSGARLQTLVIDEGFGSQDAQGRQRLVEAINLVSESFEKILVITHLEELKDAFPSRIEVTKTFDGSRVEVFI